MSSRIPLIYGCGLFGKEGTLFAQIHDLEECQKIIDGFTARGHKIMDTSRVYGNGSSEEFLGLLDLNKAMVDTKAYPVTPGDAAPVKLRESLNTSIRVLGPYGRRIRVFFLHVPDRSVPFEETLSEVDKMYRDGLFEEFGLSNFYCWEVAEIVAIAKARGWIRPTVYQGPHNALERDVESELIPCLRKHGIRFHAYSPMARGLLSGVKPIAALHPIASARYSPYAAAFDRYVEILKKYHLTGAQVALRWIQHHSQLTPDDAVIIGASTITQLEENLDASEQEPLPQELLDALSELWMEHQGRAPSYAFPVVHRGK
ncbi:Aldo keto reductase [Coniophora puteana RWD-64-598 SS2]|uniref:Aldo keto reductase n=1 Tax=Coniophora puteana (strain RWD-64-598) TaxID=741705 RepID=A0A5M3MAP0_CONPW|nr:Aldo keto reductase [Coniophora puteana RWD-64-598 SS2]EIW75850.1 Aldo keto reductase [Coniophora puteana RWD-64-598 SS2]